MQTTKTPVVHVTNYQKNIDGDYLKAAITNLLSDGDLQLWADQEKDIYVSIAYFTVNHGSGYNSYVNVLTLSMAGKSYTYKLQHNNEAIYDANKAIIENNFDSSEQQDEYVRLFESAFEAVIEAKIETIVLNLVATAE